ncbi:beta-L-arabinofuranosidase domain-containing protein [Occultella kanbiaonis]|uniref:beta-L-arabinofuranosidase domain-containing protein n=1 Tax=Occultella kanbiaonis TaxID=2675754 RepID=UPI0013CF4DFE|nr:beta-L-arabinofuranosidase domain-containing protein [Occultella kanbiaonis]
MEAGSAVFAEGRLGRDSVAQNVAAVPWWNGESEGNWLWGWAAHIRMVGTDAERAEVDARLAAIAAAAAPDGYVGMFDAQVRAPGYLPGDCWTQSRVLGVLREWAEYRCDAALDATLERGLAELVARLAEQLGEVFADPEHESLVRGHDLQIVDVLADAGRSGNGTAAQLADAVYRRFDAAALSWVEDDAQLRQLRSAEDFRGHGPHVVENLRIPLRVAEAIADRDPERADVLAQGFAAGWSKLGRALGVTGAIRSDESVGVPEEPARPFPEAGQEYCAITELALTALHAARIAGSAGALDLVENLWLNAAQAARAKDAGGTAYFTAENQVAATAAMGARWDLSPTHDDAAVCCVPNAGRILPIVVDASIVVDDGGVQVWLYGPVEAVVTWCGAEVRIRQNTAYPFEDIVRVEVAGAPAGFALRLRRPDWASHLEVDAFAGATVVEGADGVVVSGDWPASATVVLTLPATIRTEHSIDGRTALARGPLVFARDIPADLRAVRSYPGSDLTDRDATPREPGRALPPYLLPDSLERVQVRSDGGATEVDPWVQPPFVLQVEAVDPNPRPESIGGSGRRQIDLVPIGATTLRHTCLPSLPR